MRFLQLILADIREALARLRSNRERISDYLGTFAIWIFGGCVLGQSRFRLR